MGRKERIARAPRRTAAEARETADRDRKRSGRSTKASGIQPHRHCSVCWAPIPLAADPAICGSEDCTATFEKREGSRKRLTIMLYLFPAIAILLAVLSSL
jgi:predicted nucleic acid-binding Zn ribbon protein